MRRFTHSGVEHVSARRVVRLVAAALALAARRSLPYHG